MVAIRDLSLAGRLARLWWRKRRFSCRGCRRTHTERHPDLPSRQRVSTRFRARLAERAAGGGAHAEIAREERTSRYQVARALSLVAVSPAGLVRRLSLDEAHHRAGRELATVISDLDRRRVVEVIDGRSQADVAAYLRGLSERQRHAIEVVSIDPMSPTARRSATTARRADRGRPLPPGARRQQRHGLGAPRPPAAGRPPRAQGRRRNGALATWAPELFRARRLLTKGRERLGEAERRRLCELFAVDPVIGHAWALKEAFRAIYRAADRIEAERRLQAFLGAVARSELPAFTAFARGLEPGARTAGLLRGAHHQRLRRGRDQQDQGDQAPRLRAAELRELPSAGPHSMRLTGPARGPDPAGSARTLFSLCFAVSHRSRGEIHRRGRSKRSSAIQRRTDISEADRPAARPRQAPGRYGPRRAVETSRRP